MAGQTRERQKYQEGGRGAAGAAGGALAKRTAVAAQTGGTAGRPEASNMRHAGRLEGLRPGGGVSSGRPAQEAELAGVSEL